MIEYTIDTDANLIRVKCTGTITADDQIKQIRDTISDPLFKTDINIIVDFSEAEFELSFSEQSKIKEFIKRVEHLWRRSKVALITPGDQNSKSALNLFMVVARDLSLEIQIFDNTEEAEEWILG